MPALSCFRAAPSQGPSLLWAGLGAGAAIMGGCRSARGLQRVQGLHLGVRPAGCYPREAQARGLALVGGRCPGKLQGREVSPAVTCAAGKASQCQKVS